MDPDTWVTIGAMVTLLAFATGLILHMTKAQVAAAIKRTDLRFEALKEHVDARFDTVDAQFEVARAHADAQFEILRTQLTGLEKRVGSVEGDMSLVKAHLLGVTRAG